MQAVDAHPSFVCCHLQCYAPGFNHSIQAGLLHSLSAHAEAGMA